MDLSFLAPVLLKLNGTEIVLVFLLIIVGIFYFKKKVYPSELKE